MASTLILGCDRIALTMAKLLSAAGERVFLLNAPRSAKLQLRNMNVNNVSFADRLNDVQNVQAVFAFNKDSLSDMRLLGSVPVAAFDGEADWHSHVSVKLNDPIELTMTAQIRLAANTDPTAFTTVEELLEKAGIRRVVEEQPDAWEEMVKSSECNQTKPRMDDIVTAVLTSQKLVDLTKLQRH